MIMFVTIVEMNEVCFKSRHGSWTKLDVDDNVKHWISRFLHLDRDSGLRGLGENAALSVRPRSKSS